MIKLAGGKVGEKRLIFEASVNEAPKLEDFTTDPKDRHKEILIIWGFPLSFFDEGISRFLEELGLTKTPKFRVDGDGNISVTIGTDDEKDETALFNLLKEENYNVRLKEQPKKGTRKPGCVVTLETGCKEDSSEVKPKKKKPQPKKNPVMAAVAGLVGTYIEQEGMSEAEKLKLALHLLPKGMGLYKKDTAAKIPGSDKLIVDPIKKK